MGTSVSELLGEVGILAVVLVMSAATSSSPHRSNTNNERSRSGTILFSKIIAFKRWERVRKRERRRPGSSKEVPLLKDQHWKFGITKCSARQGEAPQGY